MVKRLLEINQRCDEACCFCFWHLPRPRLFQLRQMNPFQRKSYRFRNLCERRKNESRPEGQGPSQQCVEPYFDTKFSGGLSRNADSCVVCFSHNETYTDPCSCALLNFWDITPREDATTCCEALKEICVGHNSTLHCGHVYR